jgi:hypothetical protein
MHARSSTTFRPCLEQFEARQLLSSGSSTIKVGNAKDGSRALAHPPAAASGAHETAREVATTHTAAAGGDDRRWPAPPGAYGYLAFRVTNTPFQTPYELIPPFQQVLVQGRKPVPGQVYNVTDVTVKNGTAQTFTAANAFTARMTNQPRSFAGFPILTGNEQWKPGQILVFYVLTKKYYPVSFVAGGFQFNLGGRSSTAVPGPSGIFLRLKYNPATFARTLNWIVAFGQGNQLGQGARFGLPNTSINELVDARTHRQDFAGHF